MDKHGTPKQGNATAASTSGKVGSAGSSGVKPKKREWAFIRNGGGCYRNVTIHKSQDAGGGKVRTLLIPAIRSYARESMSKCKEDTVNTERVFVPGDLVTYVGMSVIGPTDNACILVEKRRSGKLKTWMRPLSDVRSRVVESGSVVLECPVCGEGILKSMPTLKAPDVECLAVSLDGKTRVWVEIGLFQEAVHESKDDQRAVENVAHSQNLRTNAEYADPNGDETAVKSLLK